MISLVEKDKVIAPLELGSLSNIYSNSSGKVV